MDAWTRRMGSKRLRPALMIGLALLLVACGRAELYGKLTEGQANEMIAVLQSAGISADKADNGEKGWTLSTGQGDFARAVEILHAQGLPREEFATLGTVFKKEGFVSSPTEERARLIYGLSQELSHTISEIDGVVQARVHLALPQDQPLADAPKPSGASVFIKYRPGTDIQGQVGKIKALVVNSIEGLKYENVSVETFPAQPLPVAQAQSAGASTYSGLATIAPALMLLLLGSLGYPAFRRWLQRRAAANARTEILSNTEVKR
ncbi:type III secretion protein J [Sphingomonas sp. UYAg733]